MTSACNPETSTPSLEATNTALQQMVADAKKMNDDEEMMIVRRRMFAQKLHIVLDSLRQHLPDGTGVAPDRRFPELNHIGD